MRTNSPTSLFDFIRRRVGVGKLTVIPNYNLVKDRIEEFKQLLQDFKEAHAAYHSHLCDENEIKESNDYYDAAVLLGTDLARDVGNWISLTAIETRSLQS